MVFHHPAGARAGRQRGSVPRAAASPHVQLLREWRGVALGRQRRNQVQLREPGRQFNSTERQ